MLSVVPVDTPSLGDRSYLVHDGHVAAVIDPQRDIDRLIELIDTLGVRVTHVFETHIHNDYVTGGLALSKELGASYHVSADDEVRFGRVPVRGGDDFVVSPGFTLTAVATPGHTFTHLSYVLSAAASAVGVFSGGSMLFGTVGRPDLLGPDNTERLAQLQHRSARLLAERLDDQVAVYPTHGFGSYCSVAPATTTTSSIGLERATNPALTLGVNDFVRQTISALDTWPKYYGQMGLVNRQGPAAPTIVLPPLVDVSELERRLAAGEWLIDVRPKIEFLAGHLPGALSFPLGSSFVGYVGWLVPWDADFVLLGQTHNELMDACRDLYRIGMHPVAAALLASDHQQDKRHTATLSTKTFEDLAYAMASGEVPAIVDVRQPLERTEGRVAASEHLPFHDIAGRWVAIPPGSWIYCRTGYRALIVGSYLEGHGRDVVVVDDFFENAAAAGLRIARGVVV